MTRPPTTPSSTSSSPPPTPTSTATSQAGSEQAGSEPPAPAPPAPAPPASAPAPWTAERAVSPADVAQWLAVAGHPPRGPVRAVAEGFDNYIFEADGLFIRAARRAIAAPDLRKEARLLPALAAALPLDVPTPALVPDDLDTSPWPWFAFKPVTGDDCVGAVLRGDDLTAAAASLGTCLRTLHALPWGDLRQWVRADTYRRADMPYRVPMARARLTELLAELGGDALPWDALTKALDDAEEIGALPSVALIHGDLHIRHLMLAPDNTLRGLIDWGDAHIGHPACDLYPAWSLFRPHERAAFFATYGAPDSATLRAGRVIAIYINAVLARSALDFGLPDLRAATLEALRRAAVPA